ncbi:DUF726 domain-containing protein [Candidatus Fermentibacterales bacterium]|nr:DUF726 domain-containing protein [Candidatus Fermentibacterales bacterium]
MTWRKVDCGRTFDDQREPLLRELEPAKGLRETLVFVPGFHTSDYEEKDLRRWCSAFRRAGWHGRICHLWWDSGVERGGVMGLADAIDWVRVNDRARETGERWGPALLCLASRRGRVTVVAHSLGASLAYHALAAMPPGNRVLDVVLLAAAVSADSGMDWAGIAEKIRGRLYNLYSQEDESLGLRFRIGQAIRFRWREAAGRKGILRRQSHSGILNMDATALIGTGHTTGYLHHLGEILGDVLWRRRWRRTVVTRALACSLAIAASLLAALGVIPLP